ncbi:ROK family protein [Paenibacillus sp. Marseille-Q4541]|uniref:ROK family protein n=1 Tax=Paenibacillus sp. Marseille-Q4541 TaxID=2831522 RepID=UPI001BA9877B|nr:ROK family protein [Paenibacillus sp. Marseille-Q4541]
MKVFIGVDGGGSKTEVIAMLEDQSIVARSRSGSTNPYATTPQNAANELEKVLDEVFQTIDKKQYLCEGICLGMSGVYHDYEKKVIQDQVVSYQQKQQMSFRISIQTEGEISLMAATGKSTGVLVIAGTGSIVYGFPPNSAAVRTGGWGHLLGDEGSGYQIGLHTLQGVMKSHDRVLPNTMLTSLLCEAWNLSHITELRTVIYGLPFDKKQIASVAKLCIEAAELGDELAQNIIQSQAVALANTTIALLQSHPYLQEDIVLAGSIFLHSPLFRTCFTQNVQTTFPRIQAIVSSENRTPAYGAALLAQQLFSE